MAFNGKYPVRMKKPTNGWGEIMRANVDHECWGGETQLPNGRDWLISHSPFCDGRIHPNELYLRRIDRRDRTALWRVSIWCAVRFHEDRLDGDLAPYYGYSDGELETFKEALVRAEKALTELPDVGKIEVLH